MSDKNTYKSSDVDAEKKRMLEKMTPEERKDYEEMSKADEEVPASPADESSTDETVETTHSKTGPSPMLIFQWRKGQRRAFAYAYLLQAEMTGKDGDHTISLDYGFCQVVLRGLNLEKQFHEITSHRADLIPEVKTGIVELRRNGVLSIEVINPEKDTPRELPM